MISKYVDGVVSFVKPAGGHIDEHDVCCSPKPPVRHGLSARRGPHTSAEVIAALKAEGITMSAPYLSQLRSGNRTNPSAATMAALANFFRIKPAYFTDDEYYEKLDKELSWWAAMRNENIRRIAMGAADLSPEAQEDVAQRVEELRRKEHLDA
ncbi:ESX-1 secretion-associated regulator EspR [Mycobacterium xenopi 3993]|nr:ESX-1 secretion-associated regulator EspR [Mycobacterium xenopi 3993]